MQYFLKSAVGPNSNLSRIIVFNPQLFGEPAQAEEMKQRYRECFSKPFHNRIVFNPKVPYSPYAQSGTLRHFVTMLGSDASSLFFAP
jgi:hypothetical protein